MMYRIAVFLLFVLPILACQQHQATQQQLQSPFREVFSANSPDGKRRLIIREFQKAYTQVLIEFRQAGIGRGVYAPNGTGLEIKTWWKSNDTVVIETRKEYKSIQKWDRVQGEGEVVRIVYVEK